MKAQRILFALALAAAAAYAQDATWLPAKSSGAMILDYKAIRANPMLAKQIDKIVSGTGSFGGTSAVLAEQLQKDIDKMLAAFIPGATADASHGVAFVSGSFDTAQLAAALKADPSCKVSVKDGVTVYAVPSVAQGGKSSVSYTAFPAKGLIVGADDIDTLLLGLGTMNKKNPALPAESMISRALANAATKKYPLLVVGDTSSMAQSGEKMPLVGIDLPSFFALTLKEKDAAHVLATLTGVFASAEQAQQAATTLDGMKTMFAMQAMAQGVQAKRAAANPLASLISAMSITSNGKNANASLTIDESLVSSLTSLLDAGMIAPSGK